MRRCNKSGNKIQAALGFIPFLFLLILPNRLAGLDPLRPVTEYISTVWGPDDGLPSPSITCIVQTGDGYIWLGTHEGLVRFDGVRFSVFRKESCPSLRSNVITSLYAGHRGYLWIGTEEGLARYHQGEFVHILLPGDAPVKNVSAVLEDFQDRVWVGTPGSGLICLEKNRVAVFSEKNGLLSPTIRSLSQDRDGRIWILSEDRGIQCIHNGFINSPVPMNPSLFLTTFTVAEPQNQLFAASNHGFHVFEKNQLRDLPIGPDAIKQPVQALCFDRDAGLWAGTAGSGIIRIFNHQVSFLSQKNGFPGNFIHCIFQDREGSLWVGTEDQGLIQLKDNPFIRRSIGNGEKSNEVVSVLHDHRGGIWFGTYASGLAHMKGGTVIRTYFHEHDWLQVPVRTLAEDPGGRIWVGTEKGLGFLDRDSGRFHEYSPWSPFKDQAVDAIIPGEKGNLLVSVHGPMGSDLYQLSPEKKATSLLKRKLKGGDRVKTLLRDQKGQIWAGTRESGLLCINPKGVTCFTTENGLCSNHITTLLEDETGNLWIGSYGNGLSLLRENGIYSLNSRNGLYNDLILSISQDSLGNLWIGFRRGIFRISKNDILEFIRGKTDRIQCIAFSREEGMPGSSHVLGFPPVAAEKEGTIWYPTIEGLFGIDPGTRPINPVKPGVIIEGIQVDDQWIPHSDSIILPPGKKRLVFHFTATSFPAPGKVQFRYRLIGYERKWVNTGAPAERTAHYMNLAPGRYRFRVRACNNDGVWNDEGDSIDFQLRPHFYQSRWFYLILVSILIVSGGVGYKLRIRHLLERERKKYERSALGTTDAESYKNRLLTVMEKRKPFLDPSLNLAKLASMIPMPTHYLSQVLNETIRKNFFDFINSYRIGEAMGALRTRTEKSVLEVAYECGFNSKSAFNRAFKKYTSMTPLEFKKKETSHPMG